MTEEQLIERKAMFLKLFWDNTYVPMKLKELAILLDIPKNQREELKEVLDSLLAEGKIGISKKGKYGTLDRKGKTLIPCCKESEQDVRNLY